MIAELSFGKRVKDAPKRKWLEQQERLRRVVLEYENYKNNGKIFK